MKKLTLLLLITLAAPMAAQVPLTTITGTVQDYFGQPLREHPYTIREMRRGRMIIPMTDFTDYTDTAGVLTFRVPRSNFLTFDTTKFRIYINAPEYNKNGDRGIWLIVPDAPTAELSTLPPASYLGPPGYAVLIPSMANYADSIHVADSLARLADSLARAALDSASAARQDLLNAIADLNARIDTAGTATRVILYAQIAALYDSLGTVVSLIADLSARVDTVGAFDRAAQAARDAAQDAGIAAAGKWEQTIDRIKPKSGVNRVDVGPAHAIYPQWFWTQSARIDSLFAARLIVGNPATTIYSANFGGNVWVNPDSMVYAKNIANPSGSGYMNIGAGGTGINIGGSGVLVGSTIYGSNFFVGSSGQSVLFGSANSAQSAYIRSANGSNDAARGSSTIIHAPMVENRTALKIVDAYNDTLLTVNTPLANDSLLVVGRDTAKGGIHVNGGARIEGMAEVKGIYSKGIPSNFNIYWTAPDAMFGSMSGNAFATAGIIASHWVPYSSSILFQTLGVGTGGGANYESARISGGPMVGGVYTYGALRLSARNATRSAYLTRHGFSIGAEQTAVSFETVGHIKMPKDSIADLGTVKGARFEIDTLKAFETDSCRFHVKFVKHPMSAKYQAATGATAPAMKFGYVDVMATRQEDNGGLLGWAVRSDSANGVFIQGIEYRSYGFHYLTGGTGALDGANITAGFVNVSGGVSTAAQPSAGSNWAQTILPQQKSVGVSDKYLYVGFSDDVQQTSEWEIRILYAMPAANTSSYYIQITSD